MNITPVKMTTSLQTPNRQQRHSTQPNGRLVPTTVEIDHDGNPMFSYSDPTPRKMSPKIVATRSLLDRLANNSKRGHKRSKSTGMDDSLSNRQPPQDDLPVLHQSWSDDPNSSTLLFEYEDEDFENHSVHSVQSVQSTTSSIAGSIAGSVASLAKVKLRLRRNRKKTTKQEVDTGCTVLSPLKELESYRNSENEMKSKKQVMFKKNLIRRISTDSSTRSTSSRASRLLDMDVPCPPSPRTRRSFAQKYDAEPERVVDADKNEVETAEGTAEVDTTKKHEDAKDCRLSPEIALKAKTKESLSAGAQTKNELELPPVPVTSNVSASQKPPTPAAASERATTPKPKPLQPPEPGSLPFKSPESVNDSHNGLKTSRKSKFKIYLLLLHPTSKIFELIQLFFDPTKTTVRDAMAMIPSNATELALGNQVYTGLCRPNKRRDDEHEINDLDQLIELGKDQDSAKVIRRGEILVAIPEGYTAEQCANLSQGILKNPRIRRLLEKSDRSRRRSTGKEHRRRRRSSTLKSVEVLDRHDEEMPAESESIQEAMEKAEKAAAVANAAVHELPRRKSLVMAMGKSYRYTIDRHVQGPVPDVSLESALQALDGSSVSASMTDASYSLHSYEHSIDRSEYSMDKSLSSWSRSLDTSFAGSHVNGLFSTSSLAPLSTPAYRRRSKQIRLIRRVTVGVLVLMSMSYFADQNGFASRYDRSLISQQPMGVPGLIHVLMVFVALVKLQLLSVTSTSMQGGRSLSSRCPFLQARDAAQAR